MRRLSKVRSALTDAGLDGLLVTFPPHVRYLTGFTGTSAVVCITGRQRFFLTDGRYALQSRDEVRGWTILRVQGEFFDEIESHDLLKGCRRIGIEERHLRAATARMLKGRFQFIRFVPADSIIETLAAVKDRSEIAALRKAVQIADTVCSEIVPMIVPGVSEKDIAAEIVYRIRKNGGESESFDPIISSGRRSAYPHARPSVKKIADGDPVIVDFGAIYDGYHSDITRTIGVGNIPARVRTIHQAVLDARNRAIDAARPGITAGDLDRIARKSLARRNLDGYFVHSLGHGIGLQIHEAPLLSSRNFSRLEEGNTVTIEPGVYIAGLFGVRIEDDIVLTADGCRILSTSPTKLSAW